MRPARCVKYIVALFSLDRYGQRATIGSAGQICIEGHGVLPLHAEIIATRNANGATHMILRTLGGEVWLERGFVRRRLTLTTEWQLADGDVICIGRHRFVYQDLGVLDEEDLLDGDVRRAVRWFTS